MYSIILAASISAVVAVAIYAVVTNLVIKTSIRKRREGLDMLCTKRHIDPARSRKTFAKAGRPFHEL